MVNVKHKYIQEKYYILYRMKKKSKSDSNLLRFRATVNNKFKIYLNDQFKKRNTCLLQIDLDMTNL